MPRKLPANGASQLEGKLEQLHTNGLNIGKFGDTLTLEILDYRMKLETEKNQLIEEIGKMYRNR